MQNLNFPKSRAGIPEIPYCQLMDSVRHISGPLQLSVDKEDLVVVCTVRNGMAHLPYFVHHYQALGARHMVFLDNGSTDNTQEFCRSLPHTTVLYSEALYKEHYITMSQYLAHNFGSSSWVLVADVDEFFDFPQSKKMAWRGLSQYLDLHGFTSMRVQMLDMFSDATLTAPIAAVDSLLYSYPYFDISDVRPIPHWHPGRNKISNPEIPFNAGGIRKKIFGLDKVFLTKHPLINYRDPQASLIDPHSVVETHIADVSGVFLHYKFLPQFPSYVADSVKLENHWQNSFEYKKYNEILRQNSELCLKTPTALKYEGTEQLIELGFLHQSQAYVDYCKNY